MNNILDVSKAINISKKLRSNGKKIVIAGGVFDILHIGHVKFLEKAKKKGDILIIFLENDKNVKKIKGNNRPVNNQNNRAYVLSAIKFVDYVLILPNLKTDREYDLLVTKIKPDVIATTVKDPNIAHKKRQAKLINGKVVNVLNRIPDQSSSKIAKIINKEI